MQIVVREGDFVLSDLSFEDEEILIGSDAMCNVHLPDTTIALRNAQITPDDDGEWWIETLDYASPVQINTQPLSEKVKLKHGDQIEFRHYLLQINLTGQELEQTVVEDPKLSADELAKIKEFPLPPGTIIKRRFDQVALSLAQLEQVARSTLQLLHCRDIHDVLEVALNMLLKAFQARVAWIGIRRQPKGELEILAGKVRSGESAGVNPVIELLQYRCVDRSQHVCIRKVRNVESIGSAMAVPLMTRDGTYGMIYVDRAGKTRRFQATDLDLFTALGAHIANKVKEAVEEREQRSAAVSATEVSVAHNIQAALDPKTTPIWKNYQVAAYTRSGQKQPGDVYDIIKHPDGELTGILLGHANASGSALALAMARLHSTFRVAFLHKDPPQAFNRMLNWLNYDENDPTTVDTLVVTFDPPTGKFKYSRAGRIGGIIIGADGAPRRLEGADGPAIGRVRNYEYESKLDLLKPNESLLLYSRGATTATNAKGEKFGEVQFIQAVCDGYDEPPATVISDVKHEITAFFQNGTHEDDITILLLKRIS